MTKDTKSESNGATNGAAPISSLAELIGLADVEWKEVYVPQWKRSVWLRSPASADRDEYDQMTAENEVTVDAKGTRKITTPKVANVRAELVARCLYNRETNERLAKTPADVEALGRKNAAAVAFLYGECKPLVGITVAEVQDAKNA